MAEPEERRSDHRDQSRVWLPRARAQDLIPLIPAFLLCAVAVAQVALTHTTKLTPWKGGGFGMFSTTDRGDWGARPIRVLIWDGEGAEEISMPTGLVFEARRVSVIPTQGRVTDLARAIGSVERRLGKDVSRVQVQVWRRRYEVGSLTPRLVVLAESTVVLPSPPER